MTEAFYDLLKASLHGSIVILAVLLLRQLLKKAPRSIFCLLWLLAGLRLALPFEIESPVSLQPQLEEPELSIQMETPVQIPDFAVPEMDTDTPEAPPALENQGNYENWESESFLYQVEDGVIRPITFGDIAAQIWLLGMGVMLAASAVSYWKLKRRVRMAYLTKNGCFECPGLETAFVLGFLPPKIYLPAGLTDGEKKFIVDHENTHIARHDHWYKLLGYLVLSLHWFNPLVWVGYGALCRDIELACDEHVVSNMSIAERKAYSAALLSCGGHTARIAACPVAFGESNPKKRIMNVLNYKRPTFWISLTAIIAVIFVAVCLMTSPGKPSLLEFGDVADAELHSIYISSEDGLTSVSDPDEIRNIEKLLKSISWEDEAPEAQPDESDGYGILFNSLSIKDTLYFSEDCSQVWAEGTQAYPVSDARKLREYLDSLTEAVWNRETSGEPFADIDQPAQWLRGISENAVREVQIYVEQPTVQEGNSSTTSRTMGVLSARDFDALLDILNGLPESAIVSESTLPRQNFGRLQGSLVPHGGMVLTIYDDVNQLVMMLRLVKDDIIEFILIDELDKVEGESAYLDHPRCWIIEDDTLLAFLKEMQEYPLIITPIEFFGHDTSDAEEIQRCREAMMRLKNSEELYLYITNLDDPMATTNAYMHTANGWLFKYRRPGWDYVDICWLCYEGEQFIYCGDYDQNGQMTAPYYWKTDENTASHTYQLPYPFDLDWENIELSYDGTVEENGTEAVTVLFPLYLDVFTFYFSDQGELLYFDVGDSTGEPEATTSRYYVQCPWGNSIDNQLEVMYKEAFSYDKENYQEYIDEFYQELFARKTDGASTAAWIAELFDTFYRDAGKFVAQLDVLNKTNPECVSQVCAHMAGELTGYAPYLFRYTLEQIPQTHHPEMLERLKGICNDPECTDESHDHSGISCTDENCTNSTHHHDEHHH